MKKKILVLLMGSVLCVGFLSISTSTKYYSEEKEPSVVHSIGKGTVVSS